ncbi:MULTISPECIES: DUF1800 domain-containing protein [unclassified Lacinutrix]
MKRKQIQHLYFRAGFGLNNTELSKASLKSKAEVVSDLFLKSENFEPITMDLSEFDDYINMSNEERKNNEELYRALIKKSRLKVRALNSVWLHKLRDTDAVLNEKLTLFWANVFVCKDNHIIHVLKYNNTLRTYALGDFKAFVKAIAREASMSKYLNNRQNVKLKPNENFARELMELFTLGLGEYTEQDIKEAARAFTGWRFEQNGDFTLNAKFHDYGEKTFLGQTGTFDGDDIIDIILQQKACARFICTKIYAYFINPKIDSARLEELTEVFFKDYNTKTLMHYIFSSDWFYEEENIGVKIKSPMELFVGIQKIVPLKFKKQNQLLFVQKLMGQVLLNPPNVAGWKQDRNWIDSNTLMFRLKLASVLLNGHVINIDEKGEFEDAFEEYYAKEKNKDRYLKLESSWDNFNRNYKNLEADILQELLIISPIDKDTQVMLSNLFKKEVKEYLIQLMSLPEYQLC